MDPNTQYYPPPAYGPPPRRDNVPVVVEAIASFFSLYGVGWLMAGETTTGLILLVAGLAWGAIIAGSGIATAGLGFCVTLPLHIVFMVLTITQLNARLKARGR
jgi:hypothetical protein